MEREAYNLVDDYRAHRDGYREHMNYPPRLFLIMRGLPGSGKSTFALEVARYADQFGLSTLICSADKFFQCGGPTCSIGTDSMKRMKHATRSAAKR
ncbi:hypothetical protein PR003_g17173 [Phytophthora rubi]|uniref:Zeta toxin domain-containing protein n=1 Tax=Phytophthora rubi TaxID=129364 RepID=A0A6A4EQ98_9STRA|nr:hypothetical protein PR003_g17173 [Phytophthora rubi]